MLQYNNTIFAVASGKGGVGKTSLTASIGVGLAATGKNVILVDADFGGANLHTCLGILEPKYTLFDFYSHQIKAIEEIVLETPVENLSMISGACGTLGIANQKYFQKQKLIRQFKKLPADYIILDIGSGASFNELDFYLLADEKILVVTPDPLSILEAFNFIKISLFRHLMQAFRKHPKAIEVLTRMQVNQPGQLKFTVTGVLHNVTREDPEAGSIFKSILHSFRPKIILNMLQKQNDVDEVWAIQTAAKELLSLNVNYLGYIPYDSMVGNALKAFKPFLLHEPKSKASHHLTSLINNNLLFNNGNGGFIKERKWWRINQYM